MKSAKWASYASVSPLGRQWLYKGYGFFSCQMKRKVHVVLGWLLRSGLTCCISPVRLLGRVYCSTPGCEVSLFTVSTLSSSSLIQSTRGKKMCCLIPCLNSLPGCLGWIINQTLQSGNAKVFVECHLQTLPFQYIHVPKCTYLLKFWCRSCFVSEEGEWWMCPEERS